MEETLSLMKESREDWQFFFDALPLICSIQFPAITRKKIENLGQWNMTITEPKNNEPCLLEMIN